MRSAGEIPPIWVSLCAGIWLSFEFLRGEGSALGQPVNRIENADSAFIGNVDTNDITTASLLLFVGRKKNGTRRFPYIFFAASFFFSFLLPTFRRTQATDRGVHSCDVVFFISIVMLLTHVRYASLPRRDGICLQFSFLAKSVSTSRSSVIRCGRVGACAHTARRRSFISLACHVRFGNGDEGSGGKVEFGEERGGAASRGIRLRRHRPERMSAMTGKSLEVALKSRTEEGEGQNGSAFLRQ